MDFMKFPNHLPLSTMAVLKLFNKEQLMNMMICSRRGASLTMPDYASSPQDKTRKKLGLVKTPF